MSIGSGSKCFDLESFYFGRTLLSVGPGASVAIACTISVSGYRGNTMVGEQPFDFGQPVSLMFGLEVGVPELTSISKTRSWLLCSLQTSARTPITSALPT
jgi:hypothetical protein